MKNEIIALTVLIRSSGNCSYPRQFQEILQSSQILAHHFAEIALRLLSGDFLEKDGFGLVLWFIIRDRVLRGEWGDVLELIGDEIYFL